MLSFCSSGSMYGRPLLIARIAVAELIDTLSENDFFNLIWVSTQVILPPEGREGEPESGNLQ